MMEKTVLPFELLAIENDGFHLVVRVLVNGKKARLLIDTGASRTVFDKERIRKFVKEKEFELNEKLSAGLGTNSMQTHSVLIQKIQLNDLTIKKINSILLDLSHVNESYEKIDLPAIDGVLGSDILVQYHGIIDYKKRTLKLGWK